MKDKDILNVKDKNQTETLTREFDQTTYSHKIKINRNDENNDWSLA